MTFKFKIAISEKRTNRAGWLNFDGVREFYATKSEARAALFDRTCTFQPAPRRR
jgi:hypothetical protein